MTNTHAMPLVLQLTLLEMLSNSLHERILQHGNWWMILTVAQLFLRSTACFPLRVSKTWIRERVFSLTSTMGTPADLSCEYQPSLSSDLLALLKALTPKWHCQATPLWGCSSSRGRGVGCVRWGVCKVWTFSSLFSRLWEGFPRSLSMHAHM